MSRETAVYLVHKKRNWTVWHALTHVEQCSFRSKLRLATSSYVIIIRYLGIISEQWSLRILLSFVLSIYNRLIFSLDSKFWQISNLLFEINRNYLEFLFFFLYFSSFSFWGFSLLLRNKDFNNVWFFFISSNLGL